MKDNKIGLMFSSSFSLPYIQFQSQDGIIAIFALILLCHYLILTPSSFFFFSFAS
ncbi:hypothetical protein Lalb_Chr01g0011241 [Lupinus albus]|uniref:Uncharacterized protein n=1 Tax=Lupinus albus TaxID=3870 RepID=A0A6A4R5E8_LUPAL|nr:hypothetical protein Lalb_Chr01g0011241 [Lupinus albus]